MTIDPQKLRHLMRSWATGVAIVTAGSHESSHGMTVSSFTSVSLTPPIILVSIEATTRTHQIIQRETRFAVSILQASQEELSNRFAGQVPDTDNRFAEGLFSETSNGIPYPHDCLAVMECKVIQAISAGTHTVFLAEVEDGSVLNSSAPLLYFNQAYRKLSSR